MNSVLALTIEPTDAIDTDFNQPVPIITLTESAPSGSMTLISSMKLSADFKNINASPVAFTEVGTHNFVLKLKDSCNTEKSY